MWDDAQPKTYRCSVFTANKSLLLKEGLPLCLEHVHSFIVNL